MENTMSLRLTDDDWPMWAVAPAEQHMAGEADDDKPDDEDEDDEDSDDDENDSKDDDKNKPSDDDDSDDDEPKTRPERQAARYRTKLREAERKLAELEREKQERADAELSETDRLKKREKELSDELAQRAEEAKKLRVQTAFFAVNDVNWVDPMEALEALDITDVAIDDDGKVDRKALKKAIRELSERKTHWVKNEGDSSSGASGSQMNGKRKGSKDGPDRAKLEADFPALKNRM